MKQEQKLKTEQEIWLPIPGFAFYEVSSFGRVRSKNKDVAQVSRTGNLYRRTYRGCLIAPNKIKSGYIQYGLYEDKFHKRKTHYAHRLVYEVFCGLIPVGMEVHHINEKKDDNRVSNLCLVTRQENMSAYYKSNPMLIPQVIRLRKARLSYRQIAKRLNISFSLSRSWANGRTKASAQCWKISK